MSLHLPKHNQLITIIFLLSLRQLFWKTILAWIRALSFLSSKNLFEPKMPFFSSNAIFHFSAFATFDTFFIYSDNAAAACNMCCKISNKSQPPGIQCDQIWRNFATLANFWRFICYLVKCWVYLLWQICYIIGPIFIIANGRILVTLTGITTYFGKIVL